MKEEWLDFFPARELGRKLRDCPRETVHRALRYFLEAEQEGIGRLKRRRQEPAALLVLEALESIGAHVAPGGQENAREHVRAKLLEIAVGRLDFRQQKEKGVA